MPINVGMTGLRKSPIGKKEYNCKFMGAKKRVKSLSFIFRPPLKLVSMPVCRIAILGIREGYKLFNQRYFTVR